MVGSDPMTPFLGVERSLSGKFWRERAGDSNLAQALAQRHGIAEVLGRVLAARGVGVDAAAHFLDPKLRDALPDPSHLKDMDKAASRLAEAVAAGERIGIFGDYDVDGATSSALLDRFLTAAGGKTRIYIPDRLTEGYGPNRAALRLLREEGAGVVITVDCGVTAFEPLEAAAADGLDVIVVDHHVAEPRLPPALAVVNPNRLDEDSPHRNLAAVGVAFLLAVAVNRALRRAGWYKDRAEPDLMEWLDLVALGTVCDVVPLTGLNRALVTQGLKVMRRRGNLGIAMLAEVGRVGERLDAYHAGYIIGPRVNAGGRVGACDLGARLLTTGDEALARDIARRLDAFNTERREIEAQLLAAAIEQVEAAPGADAPVIFAWGEGWHPGVIGIVAGRLKERYNRPACVLGVAEGLAKGSGRSVPGVDLGSAVIAARQAGILTHGGGHAMAAGFTAAAERLSVFREFITTRIGEQVGGGGIVPELGIDGALSPEAAGPVFVETLERLAPFGAGNSEPRFAFPALRILYADIAGGQHVRCTLGDGGGGARLKAIAFRALESPLGEALLRNQGTAFHVAGHLRPDNWQGRQGVQLFLDDAAPASG